MGAWVQNVILGSLGWMLAPLEVDAGGLNLLVHILDVVVVVENEVFNVRASLDGSSGRSGLLEFLFGVNEIARDSIHRLMSCGMMDKKKDRAKG